MRNKTITAINAIRTTKTQTMKGRDPFCHRLAYLFLHSLLFYRLLLNINTHHQHNNAPH